jgi:hypothetical protein
MPCQNCKKVINIIEGTIDNVFNLKDNEEWVIERSKQCNKCPNVKVLIKIGNGLLQYCALCKCPINSKIRVQNEHCLINKW